MPAIDERQTAAWRIFKTYYNVSIEDMFFYNAQRVKEFGRPTSGDKKVDKMLLRNRREVRISVDKMAVYFDMGASIQFMKPDDIIHVYKDIVEHLTDWEFRINNDLHEDLEAPVEDLIKFDNFREALYPHTLRNYDPLEHLRGIVKPSIRTFTRRKSRFTGALDVDGNEKVPDGAAVAGAGYLAIMDPPPTVELTREEETEKLYKLQSTLDDNVKKKSFTAVFERHLTELEERRVKRGGN